MNRRGSIGMFAAGLLVMAACSNAAALTDGELMGVFNRLGLRFDTNAVARPVAEALLKAVDPRGQILTRDEASKLDEGTTVLAAEPWFEGLFYLKLKGLYSGGASNLSESLREPMKKTPTGLILDLRDAGGLSLDAADTLLSMFVESGTPLYALRTPDGSNGPPHVASPCEVRLQGVTCALIVNEETRDTCELLAAVLRTLPNVIVVGWRTQGDAGVRRVVELSGGERLLIADRWAVPANGDGYEGRGVKPHIVMVSSSLPETTMPAPIPGLTRAPSERALGATRLRERIGGDAALLRACDLLMGLKVLRKSTNAWVPESSTPSKKSP
jgi:C-terminal processing protease CtpA/Prc